MLRVLAVATLYVVGGIGLLVGSWMMAVGAIDAEAPSELIPIGGVLVVAAIALIALAAYLTRSIGAALLVVVIALIAPTGWLLWPLAVQT
jgi:hypothetical protein